MFRMDCSAGRLTARSGGGRGSGSGTSSGGGRSSRRARGGGDGSGSLVLSDTGLAALSDLDGVDVVGKVLQRVGVVRSKGGVVLGQVQAVGVVIGVVLDLS